MRAAECLQRCGIGSVVPAATALFNVAGLCKRLSQGEDAEKYYRQALSLYTAHLPAGRSEVADTLYQLASLLKKLLRKEEAVKTYVSAAEAYALSFGEGDKRCIRARAKARQLSFELEE